MLWIIAYLVFIVVLALIFILTPAVYDVLRQRDHDRRRKARAEAEWHTRRGW